MPNRHNTRVSFREPLLRSRSTSRSSGFSLNEELLRGAEALSGSASRKRILGVKITFAARNASRAGSLPATSRSKSRVFHPSVCANEGAGQWPTGWRGARNPANPRHVLSPMEQPLLVSAARPNHVRSVVRPTLEPADPRPFNKSRSSDFQSGFRIWKRIRSLPDPAGRQPFLAAAYRKARVKRTS